MNAEEQISLFDLDTSFSKMLQGYSVQTTEKISEPCLKKPPELSTITPQFLDLRTGAPGLILGVFWQTDGLSLGAYTMRSFGESPNVAVVSRLSQILEDKPHPKYCLSAKACQGILNRSERRGKTLPPILEQALKQSVFKNVQGATGG